MLLFEEIFVQLMLFVSKNVTFIENLCKLVHGDSWLLKFLPLMSEEALHIRKLDIANIRRFENIVLSGGLLSTVN